MLITREEAEAKVMVFLPVMIELEAMGFDPVDLMFNENPVSIADIEAVYVAIHRAKAKNPKWYAVNAERVNEAQEAKTKT